MAQDNASRPSSDDVAEVKKGESDSDAAREETPEVKPAEEKKDDDRCDARGALYGLAIFGKPKHDPWFMPDEPRR